MWNSFKLFIKELFTGIYWWASLLLFLSDYFVKPYLPDEIKEYMSTELVLIIIIILILIASFTAYHKVNMMKLHDLYKYRPEANKDRIFRIFYELYRQGQFLKESCTERRQKWDEEVLRNIKDYCNTTCEDMYILNTNRRVGISTPLDDKYYEKALEYIKNQFLDEDFDLLIKS